ncbi:MAG: hypothetical protein QME48_04925 [bacterium]|nr:hypothetical protein [bacterium]
MKKYLLIISILVYLLLFPLTRFYLIKITTSNNSLKKELVDNQKEKTELILKIDYLTSITRLEKFAFETLGLRYPSGKDYEWISKK